MENKHELTEKLKAIETEIHDLKIDLAGVNNKLAIAYQYEDDLNKRMVTAKEKTKALQIDFFRKAGEISVKYNEIKDIVDVFTGNFYKNIQP